MGPKACLRTQGAQGDPFWLCGLEQNLGGSHRKLRTNPLQGKHTWDASPPPRPTTCHQPQQARWLGKRCWLGGGGGAGGPTDCWLEKKIVAGLTPQGLGSLRLKKFLACDGHPPPYRFLSPDHPPTHQAPGHWRNSGQGVQK